MKKYVATFLLMVFICIFSFMMFVAPARALTGYDSTILESAVWTVKNTPVRQLVGAAASATGGVAGGSYAVEIIAAGAPWLAVGVAVGLGIAYVYYNSGDLVAIYNSIVNSATQSTSGNVLAYHDNSNTQTVVTGSGACYGLSGNGNGSSYYDQKLGYYKSNFNNNTMPSSTYTSLGGSSLWSNWEVVADGYYPGTTSYYKLYLCHVSSMGTSHLLTYTPADHTAAGVTAWLAANTGNSLAPETRHTKMGQGVSAPSASVVATSPLTLTEAGTVTTKLATDVATGDIVIGTDVPVPSGTQQSTSQTQTSTTTTTTINNQDGSVTQNSTTDTTSTCSAVGYDNKTFGSVLQSHVMNWQASPLIASLSNLSGVAFPSTLPTISFNSTMWGNHAVNMNDYSYVFTAIKLLSIACTTILCYRLVFG